MRCWEGGGSVLVQGEKMDEVGDREEWLPASFHLSFNPSCRANAPVLTTIVGRWCEMCPDVGQEGMNVCVCVCL